MPTDLPMEQVIRDQLISPPPAFQPPMPVPEGLDRWFYTLLEKPPSRRFRWAADAAKALYDLEHESTSGGGTAALNFEEMLSEGGILDDLLDDDEIIEDLDFEEDLMSDPSLTDHELPAEDLDGPSAAPTLASLLTHRGGGIPHHWERTPDRLSSRIQGVGLGLWGLRLIPMVDRETEREVLWKSLSQAVETRSPRVVQIRGPAGCGKTRLAQWVGERAHELGVGSSLEVSHPRRGAGRGAGGLSEMLIQHLGCNALSPEETRERLNAMLGQGREQAVADLLAAMFPTPSVDANARYQTLWQVFAGICRERALVLRIDDAHRGLDALEFTSYLMSPLSPGPLPMLIVLVVREEALAERLAERDALDQLSLLPGAERLKMDHLRPEHRSALIREILGLEPQLAARVEARTAGNPLFAVQLVGDWAVRGLLEPSPEGFVLVEGARVDLPDQLHDVWSARVERLLEGRPPQDGFGLELAAALGQRVDRAEWYYACQLADCKPSRDLVQLLLAQRLARPGAGGSRSNWDFAHGMLRESLLRRAREGGRLEEHHRICARMLAERPSPLRSSQERRGRHLLAAGETEAALEPLLEAAQARLLEGEYEPVVKLLDRRRAAMARLNLSQEDPRRGWNLLLRAQLAEARDAFQSADAPAAQAEAIGRASGDIVLLASALRVRARVARAAGQPEEAQPRLEEALQQAEIEGDIYEIAWSRVELGQLNLDRGELFEAIDQFTNASVGFTEVQDPVGQGVSRLRLSNAHVHEGDLDRAAINLRSAREAMNRAGYRRGLAECAVLKSNLERRLGRLDLAARSVRESARLYEVLGLPTTPSDIIQARLLCERDRISEARPLVVGALNQILAADRLGEAVGLHALMTLCLAWERKWAGFNHHLRRTQALLQRTGRVDVDIAEDLERAGRLALEAAQTKGAWSALRLAMDQWVLLERDEETLRVDKLIRSIPTDHL